MLTAMARLLQRQGFHGTGLNQIVAEADAPKGSLYFHFPGGKEQLAAEAVAASADYLHAALARHEALPALEAFDAYLVEVAARLEATDFADGCPIATVALEVAPTSPVVGDACATAYASLIARVAGWLERDGLPAAEAEERAFLVYAALEGALLFAKSQRSVAAIERLRARLPELLGPPAAPARSATLSRPRPRRTRPS
jgi:TetR/AcrR family transcriptional repressor of lmrAB and yxaGH operons